MEIILASESPRRKELLDWLEIPFEMVPSDLDESLVKCDEVEELVEELALQKALKVADKVDEGVVIGADTVVELNGEIIGKPANREEAFVTISKLVGEKHRVLTGIALVDVETGEKLVEHEESYVVFRHLQRDEIEKYLDTGIWKGKAGGYGIQEDPDKLVTFVEGSFTNVVGLPLIRLGRLLQEFGVYIRVDLDRVVEDKTGYKS